jgi:hypothetical protein
MSPSNGTTVPTERTSLLDKDIKGSTVNISNRADDNAGSETSADEEAGSIEDAENENPLFEGNAEMRRKMYLLFPAVSIGVSFSYILHTPPSHLEQLREEEVANW